MTEEDERQDRRETRDIHYWLPLIVLSLTVLLAAGCAGGGGQVELASEGAVTNATTDAAPTNVEMQQVLQAELARLGKTTMQAGEYLPPSGAANVPFDLHALLIDPDGEGGADPLGVQLTWTERLVGDYNMDGLVSAADLTPLGQFYNQTVEYLDPADTGGVTNWPSGTLRKPTTGESNWRLARVDGNGDGLINMQDITAIGQHWQEQLAGYRFYIQHAGSTEWEPVPDPHDESVVLEIPFGWFQPDLSEVTYYDYYVNQYRLNLPVEIDAGDLIQVVPADSAGTGGMAVEIATERDGRGYFPAIDSHYQNYWPGYYYLYEDEILGVWTEFSEYIRGDLDASGAVDLWDTVPVQKYGFVELNTYEGPDADLVRHADQNSDGTLSVADLTLIGQNYGNRLDGYAFSAGGMVMNPDDPEVPFVVPRPFEFDIQNIPDWYRILIPVTTFVDEIYLLSVMCDSKPAFGDLGTIYISGYVIRSAPMETTEPVVAMITTGSLEVAAGTEIALTGELSWSRGGEITAYQWDLDGDGIYEISGVDQALTPATAGEYTCRLQVVDSQANSADVEITLAVT